MKIILTILFPILMGIIFYLKSYDEHDDIHRNKFLFISVIITSLLVSSLLFFKDHRVFTLLSITKDFTLSFYTDGLSSVFLALISLLWPLAILYSFEYMEHEHNKNRFFMFYLITYGIVIGLASSANLITFYFMYECLTLVTLPLVTHHGDNRSLRAGRNYFKYSIIGASMAFIGIMILYKYSSSLDFVYGGTLLKSTENQTIVLAGYMLMFFGFGVKAAIFPFHGWLPQAGVAPTPVTALLHAVAVVKAGVFALMRVTYYCFGYEFLSGTWAQNIALAFACLTIVFGSTMALKQQHLKKRFAYSTISNLSYIVVGIAMMSPLGLSAALAHMFFHGIIKICLFFVVGVINEKTHKEYIPEITGYGLKMPFTFTCMTIGACALSGIPLFAGFISKYALGISAVSLTSSWSIVIILCLLLSAVLTAAYTFEIVIHSFVVDKEFDMKLIDGIKDPRWYMKWPLGILCVLMIVFGVAANSFIEFLNIIAAGLL